MFSHRHKCSLKIKADQVRKKTSQLNIDHEDLRADPVVSVRAGVERQVCRNLNASESDQHDSDDMIAVSVSSREQKSRSFDTQNLKPQSETFHVLKRHVL